MDILDRLRRCVEEYRKNPIFAHNRPGRILLKGEAAKDFADLLAKEDDRWESLKLLASNEATADEVFLDGGMPRYKGIARIARIVRRRF